MSVTVEPASTLDHTGPLIVELAGAPGSGKTSSSDGVVAALAEMGWRAHKPEEAARLVVSRLPLGRLIGLAPSSGVRRGLWWRLYLVHRLLGAARSVARDPRHLVALLRFQRARPPEALGRRRRVVHWYLRTTGAQEFFRRHGGPEEAVVFDEGQVHRVVQLFSSTVETPLPEAVTSYLDRIPRPDLLILVRCPPEVCEERIRARGIWPRLSDLGDEGLARFVSNAHTAVSHAAAYARAAGWATIEVDNTDDAAEPATRAAVAMRRRDRPPQGPRGGRGSLYLLRLSRPGRIAATVTATLSPPAIGPDVVDSLLNDYGERRLGVPRSLALGRRSESVTVPTTAGKVVVRAYPGHWRDETIRHEHSVLSHLETRGYPATRVLAAPSGDTLHHVDGRRMAVFGFVPGANLSGSLITSQAGLEAAFRAGRLLARLHEVTRDVRPDGDHHLALDEGDPSGRLDTNVDLLSRLVGVPGPEVGWLKEKAEGIAGRLGELHGVLREGSPSVAVIHGDFGLHNILFRRDGRAWVHDFELARRDWVLVDLVETLAPMAPARGRALVAGYRAEVGGVPPDWQLLAAMWEHHRLAGAVRSWESYVERGDLRRLETARTRIREAESVRHEGVAAWLS